MFLDVLSHLNHRHHHNHGNHCHTLSVGYVYVYDGMFFCSITLLIALNISINCRHHCRRQHHHHILIPSISSRVTLEIPCSYRYFITIEKASASPVLQVIPDVVSYLQGEKEANPKKTKQIPNGLLELGWKFDHLWHEIGQSISTIQTKRALPGVYMTNMYVYIYIYKLLLYLYIYIYIHIVY